MLIALLIAGLAACGNASTNIAADGSSATQLTWPAPSQINPAYAGGTHPTLVSVRHIHAGLSKSQIIALIGPPHFNKAFSGVREWDYLFTLPKGNGSDTASCQYKILFDTNMLARSFYWKPRSCAELLKTPVVATKPSPKPGPAPQQAQSFTLSADALFAFDSATVQPAGEQALDAIATKITTHTGSIGLIRIIGYTDNIGDAAYNLELSRQRAEAVLRYLWQDGVPLGTMMAIGRGEADPVATGCEQIRAIKAHMACLAPDRRVTIEISGGQ